NLDAFMPADPAGTLPPPDLDKGRPATGAGPGAVLGAPAALPSRPSAAAPAGGLVLVRLEQAAQEKKAPDAAKDPLTPLVEQARQALIQEGLRDPDPQGRLAAI